jgi:hypothetical protein
MAENMMKKGTPVLIAGNKIDLIKQRQVSQ